MNIELDVVLRITAMVLSMAGLAALGSTMITKRDKVPRRIRRVTMWVYGMLMYIAYGSGVALERDTPISPATWIGVGVLLGLVVSLVWRPDGDDRLPPDDGSVGQHLFDAYHHIKDNLETKRRNREQQRQLRVSRDRGRGDLPGLRG